jgi:hypothetical protein
VGALHSAANGGSYGCPSTMAVAPTHCSKSWLIRSDTARSRKRVFNSKNTRILPMCWRRP